MSTPIGTPSDPHDVLGYLLKHASAQFAAASDAALEHRGIASKDLGVLRVVARLDLTSQLALAETLGIDRTTMVGLLDELERKGLVSRRPDPSDRRRNVAELTAQGKRVYNAAEADYLAAENGFLGVLSTDEGEAFRRSLRALVAVPTQAEAASS